MEPHYDEDKFRNLVLYVAGRLGDDPAGGAVKLNKVLYFAEFGHVRRHGEAITGAEFQRLRWGPAPRRLLPLRAQLIDEGAARLVEETYLGRTQHRLVALADPDLSAFSEDELASVDAAIDALRGQTGTAASNLSHDEVGWQMVTEGDTIPFATAYLRQPVRTEAVKRHGMELAARLGRS